MAYADHAPKAPSITDLQKYVLVFAETTQSGVHLKNNANVNQTISMLVEYV